MTRTLLAARDLDRTFTVVRGGTRSVIRALQTVSMHVCEGEIVGLVGESGSGKSTLSRILIGIDKTDTGAVLFEGAPVEGTAGFRALRREVQYVFQDPYSALCPTMRIGDVLDEPLKIAKVGTRQSRRDAVSEMLELVGLHPDVARRLPRQLSGGQRQRVNLARALMLRPRVLICDEIVSGLDVSVQAQVLRLLVDLQDRFGLSIIFISHDLRVIRYLADRVYVMCDGRIVEHGPTDDVFGTPRHEYTRRLLDAIPGQMPDSDHTAETGAPARGAAQGKKEPATQDRSTPSNECGG